MSIKTPSPKAASSHYLEVPWSYLPKQFNDRAIEEIFARLRAFIPTGDFTLGKPLVEFEQKFAKLIGTKHAIGVNSGTDAIKLSLKALGIGPGDEVITAANTFIATVGAIVEIGATPIFVDCTDNFCLDAVALEAAITPRTKALLPVHFAGQMSDMPTIMDIAKRHSLPVVEDACQCILGNIDGKNAGSWGNSGAFSLHPLKNLNVWGDGGMIVTNDDALAQYLRKLRNHGLVNRDEVGIMGYNSRLDTTQAVVGNWLIEQVDFITDTRIAHAQILDAGLSAIQQITLPPRYTNRKLVYHLYMVFAEQRDELLQYCIAHGIETKVHYPLPVYLQPAVRNLCNTQLGDFATTDRHAKTMISFPAHEHLSKDHLEHIITTVARFYRE